MIGLTPQTLLALASKHWRTNPALIAATMISCKATLEDLAQAAEADGLSNARDMINDLLDEQANALNWRELGDAWPGRRTKLPVPEVIEDPVPAVVEEPVTFEAMIGGAPYRITIERVVA